MSLLFPHGDIRQFKTMFDKLVESVDDKIARDITYLKIEDLEKKYGNEVLKYHLSKKDEPK